MTDKINIHGIISMLLIFDATIVALISIAQQSVLMTGILPDLLSCLLSNCIHILLF